LPSATDVRAARPMLLMLATSTIDLARKWLRNIAYSGVTSHLECGGTVWWVALPLAAAAAVVGDSVGVEPPSIAACRRPISREWSQFKKISSLTKSKKVLGSLTESHQV
jgi:hypothetical protein